MSFKDQISGSFHNVLKSKNREGVKRREQDYILDFSGEVAEDAPSEPENSGVVFDLTKDALCICNSQSAYSYPPLYMIPFSRYKQLLGPEFTVEEYLQNVRLWGGNCLGMSMAAVLHAMDQLDFGKYEPKDRNINETGYDYFTEAYAGKYFHSVAMDSTITQIVELYLIYQQTNHFVNRFKSLKQKLLPLTESQRMQSYLNEGRKDPLIIIIYWKRDKHTAGHALVMDNRREPTALGNGWFRIWIYDPNHPYSRNRQNKALVSYYDSAESRYLDVNVNTGEWAMEAMTQSAGIPADRIGSAVPGSELYCASVKELLEAPLTVIGEGFHYNYGALADCSAISFASDNMVVSGLDGREICSIREGAYHAEPNGNTEFIPTISGGMQELSASGRILTDASSVKVELMEGFFGFYVGDYYVGITADAPCSVVIHKGTCMEVYAKEQTKVNLVMKQMEGECFTSYGLDVLTDSKGVVATMDQHTLSLKSGLPQKVVLSSSMETGHYKTDPLYMNGSCQVSLRKSTEPEGVDRLFKIELL